MDGLTVILVHGSGLGAWSWEPVKAQLQSWGQATSAIDLKGFGTRAAELSPEIRLADHVGDVLAAIDACEGSALLVGHSYGAYVVSEAAAVRPDKVSGVILVDGAPARKGQSLLDQVPALAPLFESLACQDVPGLIEALPADLLGLDPARLPAGVAPTRSPFQPSLDPAQHDASALACPGLFIGFSDFAPSADFGATASSFGWPVATIEGGHMALFLDPAPVARAIDEFSRRLGADPGR